MKTLIEVNPLLHHEKTGIPTYIYQLCRGLLSMGGKDQFVLWGPDLEQDPLPDFPSKQFVGRRLFPRGILERLWEVSQVEAIPRDIDIYHLPYPAIPAPRRSDRTRLVVTINDIAFARHPETVLEQDYLRRLVSWFPEQVDQADHILTISEATKRDLIEILDAPAEKVTVTYLASDLQVPDAEEQERCWREARESLSLPERYILTVGTWEPRKNLPTVLRAYHQLRREMEAENVYLCLAGGARWMYQEADRLISELGLTERTIPLGYVPREWLATLYARSLMFVYPSFYEGFGLPVLEAMACGAPVITSNTSSLPEVAGDAAFLIDPHSVDDLAYAMRRYLEDPTLRQQRSARGVTQAQQFTWERTAHEALAVYQCLAHR